MLRQRNLGAFAQSKGEFCDILFPPICCCLVAVFRITLSDAKKDDYGVSESMQPGALAISSAPDSTHRSASQEAWYRLHGLTNIRLITVSLYAFERDKEIENPTLGFQ